MIIQSNFVVEKVVVCLKALKSSIFDFADFLRFILFRPLLHLKLVKESQCIPNVNKINESVSNIFFGVRINGKIKKIIKLVEVLIENIQHWLFWNLIGYVLNHESSLRLLFEYPFPNYQKFIRVFNWLTVLLLFFLLVKPFLGMGVIFGVTRKSLLLLVIKSLILRIITKMRVSVVLHVSKTRLNWSSIVVIEILILMPLMNTKGIFPLSPLVARSEEVLLRKLIRVLVLLIKTVILRLTLIEIPSFVRERVGLKWRIIQRRLCFFLEWARVVLVPKTRVEFYFIRVLTQFLELKRRVLWGEINFRVCWLLFVQRIWHFRTIILPQIEGLLLRLHI